MIIIIIIIYEGIKTRELLKILRHIIDKNKLRQRQTKMKLWNKEKHTVLKTKNEENDKLKTDNKIDTTTELERDAPSAAAAAAAQAIWYNIIVSK